MRYGVGLVVKRSIFRYRADNPCFLRFFSNNFSCKVANLSKQTPSMEDNTTIKCAIDLPAEKRYNFIKGCPDEKSLQRSFDMVQSASNLIHGNKENVSLLDYGNSRCGCDETETKLANFLTKMYGGKFPPTTDHLLLTAGATHGLFLICSLIFNGRVAPDMLFAEHPTYRQGIEMLADNGMEIYAIPEKTERSRHQGEPEIDFEAFESLLVKRKEERLKNRQHDFLMYTGGLIYAIPTFHNPTGLSISGDLRLKLIEFAKKHDCLIVCDDCYNFLTYPSSNKSNDEQSWRLYELDKE